MPAQRVEGGIGGHFARKYHRETVHASLRSDKIISSLFVTPEIGISPISGVGDTPPISSARNICFPDVI